jgi:hypothetical protein
VASSSSGISISIFRLFLIPFMHAHTHLILHELLNWLMLFTEVLFELSSNMTTLAGQNGMEILQIYVQRQAHKISLYGNLEHTGDCQ